MRGHEPGRPSAQTGHEQGSSGELLSWLKGNPLDLRYLWPMLQPLVATDELLIEIIYNAKTFATSFARLLKAEVSRFNEAHAANGRHVGLALPRFRPEHALFAPESAIWGPDDEARPMDDVIWVRTGDEGTCVRHKGQSTRFVHARASFGHPNRLGARLYARAIAGALGLGAPDFRALSGEEALA